MTECTEGPHRCQTPTACQMERDATTTDTYGITYSADHAQRRADYITDRAHHGMTRETNNRQEANR